MNKLESKNIKLLIDFDSTFIKDESLELLSFISLKKIPNKNKIIKKISQITTDAMEGNVKFSEALIDRIKLLQAHDNDIKKIINRIFRKLINFILTYEFVFRCHITHTRIFSY